MRQTNPDKPRVGLFVTCLVDLFRPAVGLASVRLLEEAGCIVEVPRAQTCCGRPGFSSGDPADTREMAKTVIRAFEDFDHVVAPSGSCAGMLRNRYPALFADDPEWSERALAFSARVHELAGFLVDVLGVSRVSARVAGSVTYHDSCAGLRELGIESQPRTLLASVTGLTLSEMRDADLCCGFGDAACARHPGMSATMARQKTQRIRAAGAATLLAGDLGCLIGIAGRLRREGSAIEVRHVAEVLAGMNDAPPIGGGS